MILDTRRFRLHLKTETLGHSLHLFESVDSTNRVALEFLREGAAEGTTVLAERQTGGRGSNGRTWQSEPGGLYLSVLLRPELVPQEVFQLTLVAASGIARSLGRATGVPVRLKWPNDLVVEGDGGLGKLGGILTETRIQGGRLVGAVVGIGVNWKNPVPPPGVCLTDLTDRSLDLATVAAAVLSGLEESYHTWKRRGIDQTIAVYERFLVNLGQAVQLPGHDCEGRVIGVDAQGRLRLMFLDGHEALVDPQQVRLGYGS